MRSLRIPGLPTMGALCLGALAVCAASGVVVMTGYEPARPLASLLAFETARPWGWFFRALHAWSADLVVLALAAHAVESVARRDDRATPRATWAALAATAPVTLYLRVGGAALPGDAESRGVAAVLGGLARAVPLAGGALEGALVGAAPGDLHVLLTHHAATATLALAGLTFFHVRRVLPEAAAAGAALGLAGLAALARRPALGPLEADGALHGPWLLGGLRALLAVAPAGVAGVALPAGALALLAALPALPPRAADRARVALGALLAAYAALTAVAAW